MRLFVSLPLSEGIRRHLLAIAGAIVIDGAGADVRWVPAENLHLTLKFLGDVSDAELPDVIEALRRVQLGVVPGIAVGQPLPERHRGRVHLITAEIKDLGGNLATLREAIEGELEPLGFGREKRAFWPHVTLGRSRRGVHVRFEPFSSRGVVGEAKGFELLRSTLGPGSPVYTRVAYFPLG
jgi:2'-5' RNA ligase